MAKTPELVPPFSVNWDTFFQATDPATDPANMVGPGKKWIETDDDLAPTVVLAFHVWNVDDSGWLDFPIGVLVGAIPLSQKGAASGVAELDAGGKIPSAQLPLIALVKPTIVANLAARLALTAEQGDVAIQSDTSTNYMLKAGGDPTVDIDWIPFAVPAAAAPSGAGYITYQAEAALGAERVATDGTEITLDVSVGGVVKWLIAALAVVTAKIANRAVTWAKVQAIATGVLLGRTTASSGDVEEITPSARFSLTAGALDLTNNMRDIVVPIPIDGGGAAIATGIKHYAIEIPFSGTIIAWRLLSDVSTTSEVDVWSDSYANYPPVVGDSIFGGSEPALTAATKAEATGLAIAVTAGSIWRVNVSVNNNATWLGLMLTIRKG